MTTFRVALVALGLVLSASATAQASPGHVSSRIQITGKVGPRRAQRIARYWTPARMREARPMGELGAQRAVSTPLEATLSARAVTTPTVYPYSTAGRIFLKTKHVAAWCSGVAVNTPTRRVVLTAGHCLSDREGQARYPEVTQYLEFVPGYTNGSAPFGKFVMEVGYVLNAWRKSENPNFDMGAVLTYPNVLGQNVADATGGGANVAFNLPTEQEFTIVGYPGADQQRMQTCDGEFARNNPFSRGRGGPAQMLASCYLKAGSSGGPWFVGEPPVLDGLTSETVQLHAYNHYLSSPYFGSGNVGALLEGL
jgi:V8-like Glu-specific endopeptidase